MRKRLKMSMLVLVLLLAVGFAAVSTTLIINGTANFGTNEEDFDVIFTKSVIDGVDVTDTTISEDGKGLTFTTNELAKVGDKSVLDFEVTNNSTQYDASITMECKADGEKNEYYTITNTIREVINAKTKVSGTVTATLKKVSTEEISETFTCTITANAVERTEEGIANRTSVGVSATDSNNNDLNAKSYEITGEEKTNLLNSLVETGYVDNADEVDALIEVKSDKFEDIATTTFDVSNVAEEGDTVVILHFDEEKQEWEYIGTEEVDENGEVTGDFTSYSPVAFVVVKEDGEYEDILIGWNDSDSSATISVGDEINIGPEKFNVISDNEDTITMLAQQNLGTNYKQTKMSNAVIFSNSNGWEYTPGPKDIDIQQYDGPAKTYVNTYVSYLQEETGDTTLTGNLITLKELKALGCLINDDYSFVSGTSCRNSKYISWLANGKNYLTRSADPSDARVVWVVGSSGSLLNLTYYNDVNLYSIRPVITISKDIL